jgi:hypothetical protein
MALILYHYNARVKKLILFFFVSDLMILFRCILDGEMLVWDTSLNRFAEFGSNQEIGMYFNMSQLL